MPAKKPLMIIPARGGSKGIPRKNIKPLGGVPLIGYSIAVAREVASRLNLDCRNIILSTDDEEIASVAESLGLETDYRRPAELATDKAGSREVILDAMDYADMTGVEYDSVLLLQPTSPFRTTDDVIGCLAAYDPDDSDMAVTVCESSANPYYNCFEVDGEGNLHISKGDGLLTRRQDAPKAYEFNGAVYVINPLSIRRMPLGAFPRRKPVEMPKERSVDLDTPLDWLIAETLMKNKTL